MKCVGYCHLQMGEIAIEICSDLPEVISECEAFYRFCRADELPDNRFTISIHSRRKKPWSNNEYIVASGEHELNAGPDLDSVIPEIEAAINLRVIEHKREYLLFHAGVLSYKGQGVLLPADSGTGKSTLCAYLVARGWKYLSDEFAIIDPNSLMVHPFPRPICIKEEGWALAQQYGLSVNQSKRYARRSKYQRVFLDPTSLGKDVLGTRCKANWIFYLSRHHDAIARLKIPESDAASTIFLYRMGLNTLAYEQQGLEKTIQLIQRAQNYQLDVGPLDQTHRLLEQLIDHGPENITFHHGSFRILTQAVPE